MAKLMILVRNKSRVLSKAEKIRDFLNDNSKSRVHQAHNDSECWPINDQIYCTVSLDQYERQLDDQDVCT